MRTILILIFILLSARSYPSTLFMPDSDTAALVMLVSNTASTVSNTLKILEVAKKTSDQIDKYNFIAMRRFFTARRIEQHVKDIISAYRERRNVMLDALTEHWPEGSSWTNPQGGLFLWAETPEVIDTDDFFKKAIAANVAYVPGIAFYPNEEGGHNSMRLNFSYSNPATINEGIFRLGRALKEEIDGK